MSFRPLHDNIVVSRDDVVTTSAGGLLLPSGSLEKPQTGTVVSVGPDVDGLKEGDRIFYSNRAGVEFKIDGERVFLLKEENVIGVYD